MNDIDRNKIVAKYGVNGLNTFDVTEELLTNCFVKGKLLINKELDFDSPSDVIKISVNSNIIIYPHSSYSEDNGGINVMYYLAKVLSEHCKNVRIYPAYKEIQNNIFNNYYKQNEFDVTNAIVIYCEGTIGNPLKSKYVVRWLLSELGKNVPIGNIGTFSKNDLVYYLNTEHKIEKQPILKNNVYKLLSIIYINPIYKNHNLSTRNGWCFTKRKIRYHKRVFKIHPNDAYEISKNTIKTCDALCEIFNKYKYFVSYDPLTFHTFNAILCGCISIVHPMQGMNKYDWFKTTALYEYFENHKEEQLYGVAYGINELKWATDTIHLAPIQINKIVDYYKEKHIPTFINDLKSLIEGQLLANTVERNFCNNGIRRSWNLII
jgi:hypothetical protein